ncbi:hypothetical protein AB0K16_22620 [Nonomuraea jabiensis]|uniref:phage terminase large subunit family protein n=1 Tax=Nonomuraea jabiensis TaxID=882448 RepID=UPI0034463353
MSIQAEKLTDEELEAFFAEGEYEDTEENRQLIKVLDEASKETVNLIIDKMMVVIDLVSGQPLYNYQKPFARRILESLILNDGELITALFSRQSGKSETVANTVAAVMIMFPVLAKVYPNLLGDFAKGVWVGAFAPVDEQADTLYGRIVSRLTGDGAIALMQDPDINDGIKAKGRTVTLKSGSLVRRQTCHPRATIEGRTYHLVLIDEAQGADDTMVDKSITPMMASTNGTMVMTGTPTFQKNVFYKTIQQNKAKQLERGKKQLHFEADYKMASKENARYALHCKKRMESMGFDSDEFKLAYRLIWILEAGMFTTSERILELADKSMSVQKAWFRSPVVVGIDPARKQDSTIVTVIWVDWDHPDEFGFYEHRILNWLDLGHIKNWETQYHRIVEFLRNYNVLKIAVDGAGVGDAVAERLQILMPHVQVEAMPSDRATQSKRWKHLYQLLERGKLIIPGQAKTRELRTWQRFKHELENLQLDYKGPYMLAEAPNESGAHDDYCDSLALGCILTTEDHEMPEVEVSHDIFSR